jgi:murein L,D-transpeptidase YafK
MIQRRLTEHGPNARMRLAPYFEKAEVSYPPNDVVLVGIKAENRLDVWAREDGESYALVRTYPILAASGKLGPKLREGDLQVPEGVYRVESLHPTSRYHLALRLNYPNEFDVSRGQQDGRTNLGGDIMIHGNSCSIGCLAMGDEAAEDLFVLAADTGIKNITVVLTPVDPRVTSMPRPVPGQPSWLDHLYGSIESRLAAVHGDR